MRRLLTRHPQSRSSAVARIEVGIAQPCADRLTLSYTVDGKLSDILMPSVTASARGDQLWQHTCFEAFLRASSGAEYYEFNFSPSSQWAAYRFTAYRTGMRAAAECSNVHIEAQSGPDSYMLRASLELAPLSRSFRGTAWRLGLSAVVEDTTGGKSYWALAHPPGEPDFHHADCFAHELFPEQA